MLLCNGHLSYKKDGKFMFIRLCESLDFPAESLSALENAYVSVTENPEANILFKTAVDGLIYINQVWFDDATEKLTAITALHPYTLNMVLCVSALTPLSKIYADADQQEKFEKHRNSLKAKLISCKETFGIWGMDEVFWDGLFHELNNVSLGRLRFEPFHHFRDVPYKNINRGDPVILIHIPGGKPLDIDEVMASLKLAYDHFKDRFEGEIVPFMTHSWLLYPPFLREVFKEGGNMQKFAALFDIIDQNTTEYANFQNIFGCTYPGKDLSSVPQNTSLQRNMLSFITQGNAMGQGYGMFLYGENGIVK
jgi:hypothetical protein